MATGFREPLWRLGPKESVTHIDRRMKGLGYSGGLNTDERYSVSNIFAHCETRLMSHQLEQLDLAPLASQIHRATVSER